MDKNSDSTDSGLKLVQTKKIHDHHINCIAIFPSGNFISVSSDKSIKIYSPEIDMLQTIPDAHSDWIYFVSVQNDNNFVTCGDDKIIKTWYRKKEDFEINTKIENAHISTIYKVIYYLKDKLISCSKDSTIKIWQKYNNFYQNLTTLKSGDDEINSILLIEDKNILISGGLQGTKIWNLIDFSTIANLEETYCGYWNVLCRIDKDKFIVNNKTDNSLKIISIKEKKKIKEIVHSFDSWGIKFIKNKGLLLVGGDSKDIIIYRNDDYKIFQIIKDAHESSILGFVQLNNGKILSYGYDNVINVWSF
jgi:WD40 repeat protein